MDAVSTHNAPKLTDRETPAELTHYYNIETPVKTTAPIPLFSIDGKQAENKKLDTLAQLRKRAQNKYISNGHIKQLVDLPFSTMKKKYWRTYHCGNELEQNGLKLKSKYCNSRWCSFCNRLRSAKMIKAYESTLSNMKEPYFVTLTIPNVNANELAESLDKMHLTMRKIKDCLRKQKYNIFGIRKLECTFNAKMNNYHPHYHLVVDGKQRAQTMVNYWLSYYSGTSPAAQDFRPADGKAIKELFKYFTKMVTSGKNKTAEFKAGAMDVIFEAMQGRRVFQPMGVARCPVEKIEAQENPGIAPSYKTWQFSDKLGDYVDSGGNRLTGYTPTDIANEVRGEKPGIDFTTYENEIKAIDRFDNRKHWEERSNYWNEKTGISKRNRELVDKVFYNWLLTEPPTPGVIIPNPYDIPPF